MIDTARANSGTGFTAVLPTYNRVSALRENLSCFLELESLTELIVVDDCSVDDTAAFLATFEDARLRVIRQPRNMGSPAARSTGISAATTDWILMLDDDCRVPANYGRTLMRVASEHRADIVGAPWVHAAAERVKAEVSLRRARPVHRFDLRTGPGSFPGFNLETPFLPPQILARRAVFADAGYERRYRGNAWREETAFFLSAVREGFRCVLTPDTYSYQIKQWAGGQRRNRFSYEFWVAWNNWLFLRSHGEFLRQAGYISSPLSEQATFLVDRYRALLSGFIAKRSHAG